MAKKRIVGITTTDNPFNPLTQWDDWYNFDNQKGYATCCYLARVANTSDAMDDEEYDAEIERAVDEIVENGFEVNENGKVYYKKVISFV